ncbi:MAG: YggT family protein [Anaerolineae bacterium]|jgi:YggT family protein|nr:YggT family protein [Anaerolineae bacterium]MDH7473575.1 YggT family protein [Anaerolineae bacterium]
MKGVLVYIINLLFSLYSLVVVARVFLEMLVGPFHPSVQILRRFTEPILAPTRRLVPPIGIVDISPAVVLLLLYIVRVLLVSVISSVLH